MLTPLSIDLRTDYDKDSEHAVSYASGEMRIREREAKVPGYVSYTVYGLLHIPEKELAARFKVVYSGWEKGSGHYCTKGDVYSGARKIEQVFEKHKRYLTKSLVVKVDFMTIHWLKHYIEYRDNMSQIMAICYYPFFRVNLYFRDCREHAIQFEI